MEQKKKEEEEGRKSMRKWDRNGLTMCEGPRPDTSTKNEDGNKMPRSPFSFVFLKKKNVQEGKTRSPEFLLLLIKRTSPLLSPASCLHGWKKSLWPTLDTGVYDQCVNNPGDNPSMCVEIRPTQIRPQIILRSTVTGVAANFRETMQ